MKEQCRVILKEELLSFIERVRENHKAAKQVASGRTGRSMRVVLNDMEGTVFGRQAFGTLETGRKPGRVPGNFVAIIRQWMADKGIKASPLHYKRKPSERWQPKYTPQERGDMSLAGAIAHRIATKGTKLYRDGGRSDIYSNEIERTTEAVMKRITAIMSVNVESIHREAKDESV